MQTESSTTFVRDRFTWLAYFMLAFFSYMVSTRGPFIPFLRDELNLSYSVAGMHLSAFAIGMVLAGLTTDRLARRYGRKWVFWVGGGASIVFTGIFLVVHQPVLTIGSTFFQGLTSGWLLVTIQATLSDHHGEKRAIAITESNIAASASAVLAPLAVGTFEDIGMGWRMALVVGMITWGLAALWWHNVEIPPTQQVVKKATEHHLPLPSVFWAYLGVIFLGAVIEWGIIFWGADFLEKNVGLRATTASTMMTIFFLAMVIGRTIGSRLSRSIDVKHLLLMAYGLLVIGFIPLWLAPTPAISLIGLFIAGLGVANGFPLTLSAALGMVPPPETDRASGRISFIAGLAIFLGPQVLGVVADISGIRTAYGLIGVISIIMVGLVYWANHLPEHIPGITHEEVKTYDADKL
ncbi:MAG: MFS transporter [Chloroflexi bacterium]|nr:MFS transporter [Chloroflexota bacterium]